MKGLDPQLTTALEAVRRASAVCDLVRRNLVTEDTLTKKDRSPVTVADFASQAMVNAMLLERFPDIPMVAEEGADELRKPENQALLDRICAALEDAGAGMDRSAVLSAIDAGGHAGGTMGRFWTLDPIDGTKGFLRGGQYAVALALIDDGDVVLGVLGCPNVPVDPEAPDAACGCVFGAVRGQGAFQTGLDGSGRRDIHVSAEGRPDRAVFCESVESGHTAHGRSSSIIESLGTEQSPVRMDSQCKYAAVARGEASVYMRLPTSETYREKIWDHAAGMRVVASAGGNVSDIHGQPLDFTLGRKLENNRGVIATNGLLHDAVLDAVRQSDAQ